VLVLKSIDNTVLIPRAGPGNGKVAGRRSSSHSGLVRRGFTRGLGGGGYQGVVASVVKGARRSSLVMFLFRPSTAPPFGSPQINKLNACFGVVAPLRWGLPPDPIQTWILDMLLLARALFDSLTSSQQLRHSRSFLAWLNSIFRRLPPAPPTKDHTDSFLLHYYIIP